MRIAHVTAELAPIAKVGGLADVVYGLAKATTHHNTHSVLVVLPKYRTLDTKEIDNLEKIQNNWPVIFDGKTILNSIWKGNLSDIPVLLIEPLNPNDFFNYPTIYGSNNDCMRFIYFSKAAFNYLQSEIHPDIVHLHDWHTALIAGLMQKQMPKTPSILTIHNLAHQGKCYASDLKKANFVSDFFRENSEYNLLKGGITCANYITTVSPQYAHQILTSPLGGNLQSTLLAAKHKFRGILNGIDCDYWNPNTDQFLPMHYSITSLDKKKKIKEKLKEQLRLSKKPKLLVGAITRLVPQKGPNLIRAAIEYTIKLRGQFILVGSTFDKQTNALFSQLKHNFANSQDVYLKLSYDEELSHLVFAASDLFVIPSIFEPCGLTQLISMRYGSPPLVRETGGLMDTVFDGKNGFMFGPPTNKALYKTLDRAFKLWNTQPCAWEKMMQTGMSTNFDWNQSTKSYLKIYAHAMQSI